MKKIVCLLFLLFFNFSTLGAQEKITVTGQVFDGSNQEPLPFVNIAVKTQADNNLVTGSISDGNGRFEIVELSTGKYVFTFSFIGFTTFEQTLIAGGLNPYFDLGKIELLPSAENLQEVRQGFEVIAFQNR